MMRRLLYLLPVIAGALVFAGVALSLSQTPAEAQCGSQASSCKNCHEVQGELPVSQDDTGWHESHAFGDFCANCHGGNIQSTDAIAAHVGLVAPLGDVQTNCAACHPSDTHERALVYAGVLGVTLGNNAANETGGQTEAVPSSTPAQPAPAATVVVAGSDDVPELIDFNQQYAETVEGRRPINWGNLILGGLIVGLAGGGGAFVYFNERRLAGRAGSQPVPGGAPAAPAAAHLTAVDLLPNLQQLDPRSLLALKQILRDPERANGLLLTLARLDPQLIEQVRRLDRRELTLLIALAEEK
jgi:hypothetical protein